jgi:membrane protease YdiL (CAAX protease family)
MPDNRQDTPGEGAGPANDPGATPAGPWPQPGPWQQPGAWPQPRAWQQHGAWQTADGRWQPASALAWPPRWPPSNAWPGPGYQLSPYVAWQPYWPGMWPIGSVPWGQARPPAVLPVLEPPGNFHPPVDRPILSLKGRASPRLYGLGLGLGLPAMAVLLLYMAAVGAGFKPSMGPVPKWLGLEAMCVAAAVGLIALAFAQIRQRRADGWLDYNGPSPVLMFGVLLAIVTGLEVPLKAGLDALNVDVESGLATLLLVTVFLATYICLVHLVAVRSRAMTWHDIAGPERLAPSSDDWSAAAPIAGWSRRAGETIRSCRSRSSGSLLGNLLIPLAMAGPLIIASNILSQALLLALGLQPSDVAEFRTSGPISVADRVFLLIAVAILTPIGEETFFRGFATNAWGRSLSRGSTIVRGSLFFAFVHVLNTSTTDAGLFWRVAVLNFGARIPVAFALTWLYMRRRSILASGTLHACYNGFLLLIAFL